jgi:hypothetical protein
MQNKLMKTPILNARETVSETVNNTPFSKSKEVTRGPKPKKQDHNFSQSRDVREDRGTRQIKNTVRPQSAPRGR